MIIVVVKWADVLRSNVVVAFVLILINFGGIALAGLKYVNSANALATLKPATIAPFIALVSADVNARDNALLFMLFFACAVEKTTERLDPPTCVLFDCAVVLRPFVFTRTATSADFCKLNVDFARPSV